MEVSNARARIELIANATPTSTNVQNDVAIGHPLEVVSFTDANVAYSVRAIIAGGSDFILNVSDGTTTGSDAWVAGVAQVETATAAGTITDVLMLATAFSDSASSVASGSKYDIVLIPLGSFFRDHHEQ